MNFKRLLTNRLFRFIVPAIIFIIIVLIFRENFSNLPWAVNKARCRTQEEVTGMNIHGVVTLKYNDFRELPRFKYVDGKDTIDSDIFIIEGSEFYSYLIAGDTISKTVGSLEFKISRLEHDTTHTLIYGCE